jgi:hypothetical protein
MDETRYHIRGTAAYDLADNTIGATRPRRRPNSTPVEYMFSF